MFLVYFIIIMHHRTRHGYARSLIPILHLIHSHLRIATTMTFIATIKTKRHTPFPLLTPVDGVDVLIFLSFLFTVLLIFRRVLLLAAVCEIGYSILHGYRLSMHTVYVHT